MATFECPGCENGVVTCPKCGSTDVRKAGTYTRQSDGVKFQKFRCKECGASFRIEMSKLQEQPQEGEVQEATEETTPVVEEENVDFGTAKGQGKQ